MRSRCRELTVTYQMRLTPYTQMMAAPQTRTSTVKVTLATYDQADRVGVRPVGTLRYDNANGNADVVTEKGLELANCACLNFDEYS